MNYFGNLRFYDAAKALDQKGELNLNMCLSYEILRGQAGLSKEVRST